MGAANSEIEANFKVAQGEIWNKVMTLCSQNILKDISSESQNRRVLGSVDLLSELIRIDLKSRADPR